MGSEFWEVAEPFTRLTAREVTYGDRNRYVTFLAVMLKLGEPVTKTDCIKCVSDALAALKKAHRIEFTVMPEKQTYILKDLSVVWKGVRYEVETMTDEIAREMLAQFPGQAVLFKHIPKDEPKAVEVEQPARKKKKAPIEEPEEGKDIV